MNNFDEKDMYKGKWNEVKAEFRQTWGKVSEEEIERAKSNLSNLGTLLQQRYSQSKEEAARKISELLKRFNVTLTGGQHDENSHDEKSDSPGMTKPSPAPERKIAV